MNKFYVRFLIFNNKIWIYLSEFRYACFIWADSWWKSGINFPVTSVALTVSKPQFWHCLIFMGVGINRFGRIRLRLYFYAHYNTPQNHILRFVKDTGIRGRVRRTTKGRYLYLLLWTHSPQCNLLQHHIHQWIIRSKFHRALLLHA